MPRGGIHQVVNGIEVEGTYHWQGNTFVASPPTERQKYDALKAERQKMLWQHNIPGISYFTSTPLSADEKARRARYDELNRAIAGIEPHVVCRRY